MSKFLRQSLRPNLCDPLKVLIKMVEKSCLLLWKFVVNQERDIDGNPVLRLGCGARELREIRNSWKPSPEKEYAQSKLFEDTAQVIKTEVNFKFLCSPALHISFLCMKP